MTNRLQDLIRRNNKLVRGKLSTSFIQNASQKISKALERMDLYRQAKHIALYQSFAGEVDLKGLWHNAALLGKYCYFPILQDNKTLKFLPAKPNTPFRPNRYGIPEPDIDHHLARNLDCIDLILMPLVAFDDACHRIGMGAGYYDRTLARTSHPTLIGVAYEFQHQQLIEPNAWDVSLSAVVTERRIYWAK